MPITPENKARYPKDWPAISKRIRERDGNKCKLCGVPNGETHPETGSKVVLTVMHLDHTPEHCTDDNLISGCQKCHNAYDAPHRKANARRTRRARKAIGELFA